MFILKVEQVIPLMMIYFIKGMGAGLLIGGDRFCAHSFEKCFLQLGKEFISGLITRIYSLTQVYLFLDDNGNM